MADFILIGCISICGKCGTFGNKSLEFVKTRFAFKKKIESVVSARDYKHFHC